MTKTLAEEWALKEIAELKETVEWLTRANKELEQDGKRLDWLETYGEFEVDFEAGIVRLILPREKTYRQAIDAAMVKGE